MTTDNKKATFGAEESKEPTVPPKPREELSVGWKRTDKNGDEYISVKYKRERHDEVNFKLFKNKRKTDGDNKPDYVAFKEPINEGDNNDRTKNYQPKPGKTTNKV